MHYGRTGNTAAVTDTCSHQIADETLRDKTTLDMEEGRGRSKKRTAAAATAGILVLLSIFPRRLSTPHRRRRNAFSQTADLNLANVRRL
jgi:hypothetical protein